MFQKIIIIIKDLCKCQGDCTLPRKSEWHTSITDFITMNKFSMTSFQEHNNKEEDIFIFTVHGGYIIAKHVLCGYESIIAMYQANNVLFGSL